jgi:tetratricopeptide (TPR) repeat protein
VNQATPGQIEKLASLMCLAILVCMPSGLVGQQPNPESPPSATASDRKNEKPASNVSPEEQESQALEKVLRSAEGNPQALIKGLRDFLAQFPRSARREQVLRTLYKQGMQANDPATAINAAEKLLDINPNDPVLLSSLVELYDRQGDAAGLQHALYYATRCVEWAEKTETKPTSAAPSEVEGASPSTLVRASAYLLRGKIYSKSGELDKAFADFEKSFTAYPTSGVAERLGDLAIKKGDTARAVDYYALAFAFPERSTDPAHRQEIRRKLGSYYVTLHHSEDGLGDLVLAKFDELMRDVFGIGS